MVCTFEKCLEISYSRAYYNVEDGELLLTKFLLQCKIEMDDNTYDEAAAEDEDTKIDYTIKKSRKIKKKAS